MVTIIVAFNKHYVIGREGKLPWHLYEDMRMFKERTMGNVVIMGRKTWESLPKKPLPGRLNIVLTNSMRIWDPPAVVSTDELENALLMNRLFPEYQDKEIFIIGGAQVYRAALKAGVVNRLLVSWVDDDSDTHEDVYFPKPVDIETFEDWDATKLGDYDGFQLWEFVRP
jgi:dihydrofolate reductase